MMLPLRSSSCPPQLLFFSLQYFCPLPTPTSPFNCCFNRQTPFSICIMLPRAPRALLSAVRPSLRVGRISSTAPAATVHLQQQQPQSKTLPRTIRQGFHSSPAVRKGIQPETSDPPAPKTQNVAGAATHITDPSPLTDSQYYEYSEHYLNVLMGEVERLQEEGGSELEAEYSVCLPVPQPQKRKKERNKESKKAVENEKNEANISCSLLAVRCIEHHRPGYRHLRPQQTTPEQAGLAQFPGLRAQAV